MALAHIRGLIGRCATIVLPKLRIGRDARRRAGRRGLQLPARRADGGAEHAIDQDHLTVRKPVRINEIEIVICDARSAFKPATQVNKTMICSGVADLREIRAAT